MTDLDAIRARAEAATEGPWHINPDNGTHIIRTRNGDLAAQAGWTEPREQGLRNAAFIAHAREDIPALLALIDEQQAEIERLRARSAQPLGSAPVNAGRWWPGD